MRRLATSAKVRSARTRRRGRGGPVRGGAGNGQRASGRPRRAQDQPRAPVPSLHGIVLQVLRVGRAHR